MCSQPAHLLFLACYFLAHQPAPHTLQGGHLLRTALKQGPGGGGGGLFISMFPGLPRGLPGAVVILQLGTQV